MQRPVQLQLRRVNRQRVCGQFGHVEAGVNRVAILRVIIHIKPDAPHVSIAPSHWQQNATAIGAGDSARDVDQAGPVVAVQCDLALQFRGLRLEGKIADLDTAFGLHQSIHGQRDIGAKKFAVLRQDQRGHVAVQIGLNTAVRCGAIALGSNDNLTGKPLFAVGRQVNIRCKIRKRPLPRNHQIDGRLIRQFQRARDDAFGFLGKSHGHVQQAVIAIQISGNFELALLAIGARGQNIDRRRVVIQQRRGLNGQCGRFAQNWRTQIDLVDRKVSHIDGDGQIGDRRKGKGFRLGIGERFLLRHGQSRHAQAFCGQGLHLQPAAQQCGAVPVQLHLFQRQPDPLVVSDGHPVEPRARAERTRETVNTDRAARAAEGVLDCAGQEAFVILLGRSDGADKDQGENQKAAHEVDQNDCPIPI